MKKNIFIVIITAFLLIFPSICHAEGSIYLNGPSTAQAGETITITIGFNASDRVAGAQYSINTDGCLELISVDSLNGATVSKNGSEVMQAVFSTQGLASGTAWANVVVKVKTGSSVGSSGNLNISNIGLSLDNSDETLSLGGTSKKITVVAPPPAPTQNNNNDNNDNNDNNNDKSNDATLKELNIKNIETFEFNNSVYEYSLTVGKDISSLDIEAITNNDKATVEIEGNENFVFGENVVSIIVTAEDGTKKTYKLNVTRLEEDIEASDDTDKKDDGYHYGTTHEPKKDNEKTVWIVISFSLAFVLIIETIYIIYDKKKKQIL